MKKNTFLIDLDGTIYLDNKIFPKSHDFLEVLKHNKDVYLFITNNSSKSVGDYVKKLRLLGIDASVTDFYTSSMATSRYLKEKFPNETVYLMGTKSLIEELQSEGIRVTQDVADNPTVVLLGFDTELTSKKLRDVSYLLSTKEVAFLATNPDLVCPVDFGYIPDCGSMAEMLYNATKKRPYFIGKPNPLMIEYAIEHAGGTKENTIIIGDRLYTDIAAGKNAGVKTICVLSGEATLEDIEKSNIKPDYVFEDIGAVLEALKANQI